MSRRVALLALALVLVGCAGPSAVSTTASPVAAAPVPTRPVGVAWRWTSPAPLHDVLRAGAGVVAVDDEGVTALDGSSGAERWRYAVPGRRLTAAQAGPDGRSLVLLHDGGSVTVLDALTGAPRWADEVDGEPVPLLTDTVVVLARSSAGGVEREARDLATGDRLWTRGTAPGCEERTVDAQWSLGTVPAAARCAGRTVLRGLDERTGDDRWTVDAEPSEAAGGAGLASATDGTLVVVTGPEPRLLVDPRTGSVRARVPRVAGSPLLGAGLPRIELLNRIVPAVAVLDLASGTAVPTPPTACADPALLVLPATTVQACSDELGDSAVVGTGPPIELGALAPDDGAPLGRPARTPEDPVLVAAPGAVVVANRSSRTVVVGLR
ncbi:PQQ-binding-like beta-propeller repeat protein [Actinomycetospora sp. OC33-EN08]|uniref:PQQ-binding-like beta-propeller repeat protein n=1 Tax=Actinomycetospora aurantiaca TaxID=3129233 RepID=A0ABU8MMD3_9PSEU